MTLDYAWLHDGDDNDDNGYDNDDDDKNDDDDDNNDAKEMSSLYLKGSKRSSTLPSGL